MVKNLLFLTLLASVCASCSQGPTQPKEKTQQAEKITALPKEDILIIADFDSGKKPNNLGGDFGAWDRDPNDYTQTAVDSFMSSIRHGDKGYSVQIYYDVDSPNPAFNGFWMKLNDLDFSKYKFLGFWIKGDPLRGFSKNFKLELKNSKGEVGRVYVTKVTSEWQEILIPLKEFKGINDFTDMSELVIVFEDTTATKKEGAIYIDDIYLK